MSRGLGVEERALRSVRGRCFWFSAVVLFVLLTATGRQAASAGLEANNHTESCAGRNAREAAGVAAIGARAVQLKETRQPAPLPRVLPRSRSVCEHGLPPPRAPTA